MVNPAIAQIRRLIEGIEQATDNNIAASKHALLLYYYTLSATDRMDVKPLMQPFLDEIEQEMLSRDPFAQRVSGLLNRVGRQHVHQGHIVAEDHDANH